jgi:hypothetical protein
LIRQALSTPTDPLDFNGQLGRVSQAIIECLVKSGDKSEMTNSVINLSAKIRNLTVLFDQIKQNSIRLVDIALAIAEKNQLITSEAQKIYDYKTFDIWINMVFDIVNERYHIFKKYLF